MKTKKSSINMYSLKKFKFFNKIIFQVIRFKQKFYFFFKKIKNWLKYYFIKTSFHFKIDSSVRCVPHLKPKINQVFPWKKIWHNLLFWRSHVMRRPTIHIKGSSTTQEQIIDEIFSLLHGIGSRPYPPTSTEVARTLVHAIPYTTTSNWWRIKMQLSDSMVIGYCSQKPKTKSFGDSTRATRTTTIDCNVIMIS